MGKIKHEDPVDAAISELRAKNRYHTRAARKQAKDRILDKYRDSYRRRDYIQNLTLDYGIDQVILDELRAFGLFPEIRNPESRRPFIYHDEWLPVLHGLLRTHLQAARAIFDAQSEIEKMAKEAEAESSTESATEANKILEDSEYNQETA